MVKKQATLLILTAVLYSLAGGLLYRQRVTSADRLWNSDRLVFAAPMLLAFVTFAWVLWPPRPPSPASVLGFKLRALGLAAVSTAVSFWVYTSIVFSTYGT